MQEAAELDFMPESGRRIAAAAIAAGLQVETAVRSITHLMHHQHIETGNAWLDISLWLYEKFEFTIGKLTILCRQSLEFLS